MPCTTHSVTTGLTTRVPFVAVRRPSSLSGGLALAHETSTRAVSWETPYLIAYHRHGTSRVRSAPPSRPSPPENRNLSSLDGSPGGSWLVGVRGLRGHETKQKGTPPASRRSALACWLLLPILRFLPVQIVRR